MPLVRIDLPRDKARTVREGIAECVHRAMMEVIDVPAGDRFQIISEHDESGLICDPKYLGIERTRDFMVIQITLVAGRTVDQKKQLYRRIVERIVAEHGWRAEDIFISLVEVPKENWSFGLGEAQYADIPPAHLKTNGDGNGPWGEPTSSVRPPAGRS